MKEFGQRLRELRMKHRLSQEQLAIRAGVDRTTVSKYESGEREPSFGVLILLSEALETTPNYLTGVEKELTLEDVKAVFCSHYSTEFWKVINKLWSVYEVTGCRQSGNTPPG